MTEGYQALRHGAAWLDLSSRGRMIVRGRDRARLLHNVSTNEIKKLAPGSGCYAFLLTPQGRIQADLNLLCFPDHFLVDTEPELGEKVPQLILKYKVADQVEIENVSGSISAIGLEGPAATAVLAALNVPVPGDAYDHVPWGERIVANMSVTGQPGFRIFGPPLDRGTLEAAGAKRADDTDIRLVRIENGRPRFGEDIRETSLPQETQQMHAVSFNKGCYIGQEIVERIRAQGHVNKQLVRLSIEPPSALEPGAKLFQDGKELGEVTSSVYSPESGRVAGIAYLRVAAANSGTELRTGDGITARVL
jgi:folate-binding protein YgfZ